jgi:branched-chain amino acid transport system substrate-binding protein
VQDDSRRKALKAMAAGAGVLAAGRTARVLAQAKPIRIGVMYPQSGTAAAVGAYAVNGAKIAAARINGMGGVLGRQIELVIRDDKAQPAEAALMARELLGSGINLLLGGYLTASANAVVGLLNDNNAVFQATGTSIMPFTHEAFHPNVFRGNPNIHMVYYALAKYTADHAPDASRWGGIIADAAFGESNWITIRAGLRKYYREKGKVVEFTEPVKAKIGTTDFRVQIANLMTQPIDGLYLGLIGADYATFVNQATPFGLFKKTRVVLDGTGGGLTLGKTMRKALPPGQISFTTWYPPLDKSKLARDLLNDLKAGGDATPDAQVVEAHNAVIAYAMAIKAAGSTDTKAVVRALEDVSFDSAGGRFKYRKQDHQVLMGTTGFWLEGSDAEPGYVIKDPVTIPAEDTIEPASPGKPYNEPV